MTKAKEIVVPILNNEYKVIVCFGGYPEVKRVLKRWNYNRELTTMEFENRRGICFYEHSCHPVIAMPRRPKTPEEIGTLAHESCHAIEDIMGKIKQPLGDEIFAHSVGAVVRTVLSHIK